MIGNIIRKFLLSIRYRRNRVMFDNYFKRIIASNPPVPRSEHDDSKKKEWQKKWSVFGLMPLDSCWEAFRGSINGNINLVPNEIGRNFLEPILTPEAFQPFYNDKNSLGLVMEEKFLPKTYFRCINKKLYDGSYHAVQEDRFIELFDGVDRLVVKPAKDMGGRGVSLFVRKGEEFYDSEGNQLTMQRLLKLYKTDFLIQECLKQSEFMSQFNETSVNTLRIASYRNVKTGEVEILGAVLRIGGKGSFVDNACSGGSFVYVNEDGTLGKCACNEHGGKRTVYNDIDFSAQTFVVPEYEKIKDFVKEAASRMPHMSLFANDVAIDADGNPRLIEVNTIMFSYWLYQFNGKPVFGDSTDELIEFCLKEKSRVQPSLYLNVK